MTLVSSTALPPVMASAVSTDQALPFQCSSSVVCCRRPVISNPTAQASVALLALIPSSALFTPRTGVVTSDQAAPFQWYVTGGGGADPAGPNCWPTAHASVLVRADTPLSPTLFPGVPVMVVAVQPPAAKAAVPPPATTSAPAAAPAASHFFRRDTCFPPCDRYVPQAVKQTAGLIGTNAARD